MSQLHAKYSSHCQLASPAVASQRLKLRPGNVLDNILDNVLDNMLDFH